MNQPAASATNAPAPKREAAAPPPGVAFAKAQRTGEPVPDASADTPVHEKLIPWPPAVAVAHKPMKLKE